MKNGIRVTGICNSLVCLSPLLFLVVKYQFHIIWGAKRKKQIFSFVYLLIEFINVVSKTIIDIFYALTM